MRNRGAESRCGAEVRSRGRREGGSLRGQSIAGRRRLTAGAEYCQTRGLTAGARGIAGRMRLTTGGGVLPEERAHRGCGCCPKEEAHRGCGVLPGGMVGAEEDAAATAGRSHASLQLPHGCPPIAPSFFCLDGIQLIESGCRESPKGGGEGGSKTNDADDRGRNEGLETSGACWQPRRLGISF